MKVTAKMIEHNAIGPSPLNTAGLCLLSLDGGGVRGLSSLLILRDIMTQLNLEREESQTLKPCDVFDLIGGTSTGGLIAIMLGRLELGIEECILAYTELMESIFSHKIANVPVDWSGNIVSQYDSKKLRSAIENVISRAGLSPTDPMDDGKIRRSKVFVCTTSKETLQVTRLRSYSVSNENTLPATICEAALATSAATRFFDPVSIGNHQFVDGAFGANNPIEEVEEEAADIWCTKSRELKPLVKCFVSIGTGNPAQVPHNDNLVKFLSKTLVRMATKPESTERRFMARWSNEVEGKRCFRFNVEQGLQEVHMTDFTKQSVIESATYAYLHHSLQKSQVRDCIVNLSDKEDKTDHDFETTIRVHGARVSHHRIMQILDRDDSPFRHGKPIPWVVPFERNLRYVDREILGKIKRRLFRQGQSELIAIFGLGGVGKTQIALELAYQTKDLYPDCAVFWLPAVDMESIQQAYQTMAEQLGISPTDPNADVKAIVKKYLSDPCSGRWLLIIDNADELDMWAGSERSSSEGLTRYLPTSTQGAILLTTRNTKVARHVASTDVIEVPEMDEQRATHVLQRCLADHGLLRDAETTRKLLSQLTFLPLAIVQAASFINENHMTLKSYVELLDGQEQSAIDLLSEDFEDKGRYKSIRNPVATTWLTSFEQIRQKNRVAADYLCIMACLQEKDIPFSILPPMGDVDRQKTIGVLSAYSFVRVRHGTSHIDMHRLVHLATRNWLGSINSLRAWQLYVLQGVSNHFPEVEYERRTSWRAVMPHALRLLDLTAGEAPVLERLLLLFKVATCQIYDGRPKEAQHHLEKLLEAATKLYGLEHHLSISALDGLAICYAAQGNPEKAIKLCKRILEVQIRAHGPASHEVNCALYRLSAVYRENGDTEKAGELYREIIPFFMKTLGPSSRQAMGAIYGLVWFYSDQGQISDAAELSLQLLHISRKVFGPDSPLTGNALTALAFIYMKQWRLKEAEDLLKEALDIHQRILGPEHVDTIRTKAWNAELRMYQGRHEEAIALQVECVRLTSEFYGPDHCRTQNLVMKLDEWTQPKTLGGHLRNHFSAFRRAEMMLERRKKYPKLKAYGGLYSVSRQPKNDPLLREIQEAVKTMSVDGSVLSD